jgi:cell division protein FtsI/penicillin-binding protein 2
MTLFSTFNKRIIILGIGSTLWAIVLIAHLFYYTVVGREKYLAMGKRLALRKGVIVAPRGTIFDKHKTPLAWTEKRYDLILSKDYTESKSFMALKNILGKCAIKFDGHCGVLKRGVSPENIKMISELTRRYKGLNVKMFFVRRYIDNIKIKEYLGNVRLRKGVLIGISGKEQELNDQLRGKDGEYTVMLDRNRQWINGTFKLKNEAKINNVTLDVALENMMIDD